MPAQNCSRLIALDSEIVLLQQQISEFDKLANVPSSSDALSSSSLSSTSSNSIPSDLERRRQSTSHVLQKRLAEQATLRKSVAQAQAQPPSIFLPHLADIRTIIITFCCFFWKHQLESTHNLGHFELDMYRSGGLVLPTTWSAPSVSAY
jgi:hypothetical protein